MARIDVNTAANKSFDYMKRVLFQPFSLKKWLGLGFVSLLAQSSSGGGGGGSSPGNYTQDKNLPPNLSPEHMWQWVIQHWELLALAVILLIAISVLFMWLSAVFKFVYIDQIIHNYGQIREPFSRLKSKGTSFFLWSIAYGLVILLAIGIFFALPIWLISSSIGFSSAAGIIITIIAAILLIAIIFAAIIIDIFARDFVIPAMYVRNVGIIEAWRMVIPLIKENAAQIAIYLLLLIAIAFAGGIIYFLAILAAFIVFAIPGGIIGIIGYMLWITLNLSWSVTTISIIALLLLAILMAFAFVVQCFMQPVMVFRRAFSLIVIGQADASLATIHPPTPPGTSDIAPV